MKTKLKPGDRTCPKCGSDWDGGSILETFIRQRDEGVGCWKGLTDEQVEAKMKESYGPPFRWGREIMVEIQGKYDGWLYTQCPDCSTHFDRWTGEESSWPENKVV